MNNNNFKEIKLTNYGIRQKTDANDRTYYMLFDNNGGDDLYAAYFCFNNAVGYNLIENMFASNSSGSDFVNNMSIPLQVKFLETERQGRVNWKVTEIVEG